MGLVAYALRAEYEQSFSGATLAYGGAKQTFDVAEALASGNGKIITDEPLLQTALECLDGGSGPLLKHVAVGDNPVITPLPEGAEGSVAVGQEQSLSAQAAEVDRPGPVTDSVLERAQADEGTADHTGTEGYDALTKDELQDEAKSRDLEVAKDAKKEDLVKLLEEDDDTRP